MRELTRSELRKLARVAEIAGDDPMLFDGRGERLVRACLSLNDRVVGKLSIEGRAIMGQRDHAWAELRNIRAAVSANPEEATCDEVVRVVAERDALLKLLAEAEAAIRDLVDAADLSAHTYLDLSNRMIDALAKGGGK
jgi:hypothetical protein